MWDIPWLTQLPLPGVTMNSHRDVVMESPGWPWAWSRRQQDMSLEKLSSRGHLELKLGENAA